jgi:hypothetical protein
MLSEAERERVANDDTRDGMLFRFWIKAGSYPGGYPAETMAAIEHCRTPEQYRVALTELAIKKGVNLP